MVMVLEKNGLHGTLLQKLMEKWWMDDGSKNGKRSQMKFEILFYLLNSYNNIALTKPSLDNLINVANPIIIKLTHS